MKNQILELSKKLITIPSTKENPAKLKEVIEFVKKYLQGFTYKEFEKNGSPSILFYNTKTLPKRFKIILNAHLDVVPAKKEQYQPSVKGNRLYGRGAIDMKAAAAAEIILFKELAKKINYPLALQLVTDEEIGGHHGVLHQLKEKVHGDFIIAGEPTDFGINNLAKGVLWLKIKVSGKSAHGAHLWEGENAIWKMTRILEKIEKAFPVPKKEVWKTTVNLSKIETNNITMNKVPDDCSITLDIRYLPEEKKQIIGKIKSLLPKYCHVEVVQFEPPQYTAEKNAYITRLKSVIKHITGKKPKMSATHGASDVRHFNEYGCDGITFGPAGYGLHTDNEWVNIKSLYQFYEVLKPFLLKI